MKVFGYRISVIDKYQKRSEQGYRYGDEKCAFYERVAEQIEDNIDNYENDIFETEQDIIDSVKEEFAEVDEWD